MDRRGNWATDEVEEMIESIKEREILCLPEGKKVRSLDVFKVVANDLRAKGMYRTPEQIRTKMRILRKDYFKALRSGSKSEYRACEFFTSLHDLFTDAHRKMEAKKRRLQRRQQQQQQQLRVLTDNPSNGNYQPASHRDEYPGDLQEHRTKKRTSTATSSATIKSSRSSSVISSRMLHEEAISVDQSASFAVPTLANDSGGGPGGTPDGSVNGKQRPEPLPDKYHLKLNEYLPNLNSSLANLCKTERYADVTLLVCNDEESLSIPAHRLLLGTFSSYFANIFERTTQLAPQGMMYIVLPPLVTRAAIQSLLQYMYSGETIVSADLLDDVMLCGQLLRVHGFCTRKSTTLQTQKPQPSLTSIPLVSVTKNLTLNHTIETLEEMEHVAPVFEAPRIMATYHQPRYQQQTPVHDHRPAPDRQTLLAAPVAPVTLAAPVVPAAPVAPAIPVAPVVPVAPAPERSASALAREREQAEKELELERLREREREREREQERKRELERELEMEKEKQREKEKREKEEKEREREKEEREREEEERKKKEKEREREEKERERVEKEREREEKEREREEKKREREEKERERAEKERERVEKEREREEKERQRQWEKDRERQRLRELELDRARERERDRQRQMDRERLRALGLERVRVNDMDELARFAPTRILAEPDVEMLDANGREDEDDDEDEEIRNVKTENAAATEEDDDAEDSRDSRSPTPQPIVLRPKNKPKLPLTDSMRTIDGLTSDESALEIVTNGPESSPFSSRAQNSPKSIRSSPRLESIIESDNEDLSLPNSSELPGLAAARPDDDHLDEPHSVSAPDDHLVYSPLGCQLCSDTFTTPGDWVQHVYGHCGEDQSQWKRRRMSRHDDKGTLCDSRYRCDMCSSFFSTRNDWLGHVVVDHEECINDCLIALPFNDYDMKKHSFPSL